MASAEKTEEYPFADIFNEDETERSFLLSKPTCFVIFGKPGSGKTTLARNIAQAWKCIRVEALSVLEEITATETEMGTTLQSMLVGGHSIPDELVMKLILEKLKSPEVSHFVFQTRPLKPGQLKRKEANAEIFAQEGKKHKHASGERRPPEEIRWLKGKFRNRVKGELCNC